ncbi:MAG: MFS transporter [Myxococcota bacterium]
MSGAAQPRASLVEAFSSRRLAPITLLSLSSGLPLGLVITALPAWLALAGMDIKTIGLLTLVQLPYGFKFLWSPLMDRLSPPFLGARRGWIVVCQLALALSVVALGVLAWGVPTCLPGTEACKTMAAPSGGQVLAIAALSFFIAFASASQDIVYDAYAVDALLPHEHGPMVGARSALYRVGLWVAGNIAISLGPWWGWGWTIVAQGALFALLVPVTLWAPEPPPITGKPGSLRDAVWLPFVGLLGRPRALEIIAFVLLYRLADSIAGALVSPFLLQHGFSAFDVGVVRGGVGVGGTLLGTVLGGLLAGRWGVGRALWICGVLQIVSNAGYAVLAVIEPTTGVVGVPFTGVSVNLPLQLAILVETTTGGMGWGAFGVLLLRLTDKRFSATQYALFSSLVGLARTFVGPVAGVMADALGWRDFFLLTMAFGVPGMVMLGRFVPWGHEPREITGEALEPLPAGAPWARSALVGRALLGSALTMLASLLVSALLVAIKGWREMPAPKHFDLIAGLRAVTSPARWTDGVDLLTAVIFGLMAGVALAAWMAARGRPVVSEEVAARGG